MARARAAAGLCARDPQPSEESCTQEDLLLAAAYVSDAEHNRNVRFETSPQTIRLYYFYNHWAMRAATNFFIFLDLSLALFEEPALFPLPFLATSIAEVLCLTAFFGRLVHFAKVTPQMVFWKDTKNICIMVTIVLTLIDLIIYGSLEAVSIHTVRWSRALRPVFLINFPQSRQVRIQIRRTFRSIRNTLPDILYVFLLFLFSMLIFSLMALKLFGDRGLRTAGGSPYFTDILEIAFELYVLVTTANSPDVMMPAYDFNWWYSLYFITYIIINTYIFMSVFLAVIYNNYRKHLKNEIRKLAYLKRHKMIQAFDILKVKVVTMDVKRHPLEAWMPQVYTSSLSLFIQKMVQHRIFVWIYDVIILINAVFIALDEKNALISYAEWLFLSLYITEILLKLYTYEPRAYFGRKQFWNWFDTLIIIAALVATVANATIQSASRRSSQQILDIVLVLRVLRLLRVIVSIERRRLLGLSSAAPLGVFKLPTFRFRVIVTTLINIGPTMLTFGGLVLVVYYTFAIIGMEMFHGKVQFFDSNFTTPGALVCGNPALKDTAFARDRYCKNNFNDLASSFIVLMELTVVNQWHNILPRRSRVHRGAACCLEVTSGRRINYGVLGLRGCATSLGGLVP
ncbi:two pore channel protein 2-like isoform X5 [Loxodonta africana]|uniref:two pore channel protein 2-like isoform X5 n=1 Tax=Loxodonta africana TaxID=9785 RepID=UPI0030CC528F